MNGLYRVYSAPPLLPLVRRNERAAQPFVKNRLAVLV
jgi:hypothetical protein